MQEDDTIETVLKEAKTIAVVGLSPRPDRTSHQVAEFLQSRGYRILPVNPTYSGEILGEKVYPDLQSLPLKPDIVDVFRRSEEVAPVMDQAIQISAPVVWMQLGIEDAEAAQRGRRAGILVIENRCAMAEWDKRWGRPEPSTGFRPSGLRLLLQRVLHRAEVRPTQGSGGEKLGT